MNDLSGLSWDTAPSTANGPNRTNTQSPFLRSGSAIPRQATPLSAQQSGRNTPVSVPNSAIRPTPSGHDSFSNLLPSNASKKTTSLSLQERQKQLLEEKARQAAAQHGDAQFWDTLNRTSSPAPATSGHALSNATPSNGDDDILAAFNSSAPVDRASHFPPPRTGNTPVSQQTSRDSSLGPRRVQSPSVQNNVPSKLSQPSFDDDDDPFGLNEFTQRSQSARPPQRSNPIPDDDDDILGALGRPVEKSAPAREIPAQRPIDADSSSSDDEPPDTTGGNRDGALAELVDMGFSVENSREALAHTSTGTDTQAAVGWLLNKAHDESKSRSRTPAGFESDGEPRGRQTRANPSDQAERSSGAVPAWMKAEAGQQRHDSRSPAVGEADLAHYATDIGSSLYKSANKLWKTGQKTVQKAVATYNDSSSDVDSSQPKWMRNAHNEQPRSRRENTEPKPRQNAPDLTNEAMLLESRPDPVSRQANRHVRSEATPEPQSQPMPRGQTQPVREELPPRNQAPLQRHLSPAQTAPQSFARPADRLRKQALEEETAQAYISPARRKKVQPPPEPPKAAEPELDIFSSDTSAPPSRPTTTTTSKPSAPTPTAPTARTSTPTTIPVLPKAPTRQIPPVSSSILQQSATHRATGTESFKRGDYASAHTSYTSALSDIPTSHPILIILHTNRALTALKTGDPKSAITDADAALTAIGALRGEGESIDVDGTEKPMKEYYGKALMRKAEALEHLEKWGDAAGVWMEAVKAGVGGAVSIQGRTRCEKAAGTASSSSAPPLSRSATAPPTVAAFKKPTARPPPRKAAPSTSSLLSNPNGSADSEAITRLRASNAAAAAASDEAFALHDSVSARLTSWKSGKEGNLRALLASLDTVLWAEAGWKKVGMGDLVLPGKVKVVYMRAIGKVHPDKLPQTANTEQKMISAAVFANLNEAWDKFKRDNNL